MRVIPRQKQPGEVFTPRAAKVNDSMYVKRVKLEERLIDAVHSNKFIVIHGESGNGKTWLYKKVFAENEIHYEIVNLSQVVTSGSLEAAFLQKLGEMGVMTPITRDHVNRGGIRPWNIGAEYEHKSSEQVAVKSAFLRLLEATRDRAKGNKPVLVLDNFESIIDNQDVLKQVAALVISADEDSVARLEVQLVIVGVPGNLKETFTKITNSMPVANRLTEMPEVARMSEAEARDLIRRGFKDELHLTIDPGVEDELEGRICSYTDRIAQHIHELCLLIAQNAVRSGRVISEEVVEKSVDTWVEDSLSSDVAIIEQVMNARDTKVGRKNQVLFALGQCKTEDFKYSEVEAIVREQFEVGDAALNVSAILSGFASADQPLIKRTPKQDAWRFVSPKLKMAIRTKLQKHEDGRVSVRSEG